jgi:hypothetical protein
MTNVDGSKRGPKTKLLEERVVKKSVSLQPETHEGLVELGGGTLSHGIEALYADFQNRHRPLATGLMKRLFNSLTSPRKAAVEPRTMGLIVGELTDVAGAGCVLGGSMVRGRKQPVMDYSIISPIVAFGSSATYKTSGLTIPTLLSWKESAIVHCNGSQAMDATWKWRFGVAQHRIIRFAPGNELAPDTFNPLDAIRLDAAHAVEDARRLAQRLVRFRDDVPVHPAEEAARLILTRCLLIEAAKGGSIPALAGQITAAQTAPREQHLTASDTPAELSEAVDGVQRQIADLSQREVEAAGEYLVAALDHFSTDGAMAAMGRSTFRIEELVDWDRRAATLYVEGKPTLDWVQSVNRIVLETIISRLCEIQGKRRRLLLMLDDAEILGTLAFLADGTFSGLAESLIKPYLIFRSPQAMFEVYGSKTDLLNRVGFIVATHQVSLAAQHDVARLTWWEMPAVPAPRAGKAPMGAIYDRALNAALPAAPLTTYFDTLPFSDRAQG